jgi:hypothetical protein
LGNFALEARVHNNVALERRRRRRWRRMRRRRKKKKEGGGGEEGEGEEEEGGGGEEEKEGGGGGGEGQEELQKTMSGYLNCQLGRMFFNDCFNMKTRAYTFACFPYFSWKGHTNVSKESCRKRKRILHSIIFFSQVFSVSDINKTDIFLYFELACSTIIENPLKLKKKIKG